MTDLPDEVDVAAGKVYSENLAELMTTLRAYTENLVEPGDHVAVALTASIAVVRPGSTIPMGNISNGFTYGEADDSVEVDDAQAAPPAPPRAADVIQPTGDAHLEAARDDGEGLAVPKIEVVEVAPEDEDTPGLTPAPPTVTK